MFVCMFARMFTCLFARVHVCLYACMYASQDRAISFNQSRHTCTRDGIHMNELCHQVNNTIVRISHITGTYERGMSHVNLSRDMSHVNAPCHQVNNTIARMSHVT